MSYYVYMLVCRDGSLYCGYTNDVEKRVQAHNSGLGAKYTKSRLPVTLAYYETHDSKSSALKRECEIKKLPRKKKLELIKNYMRTKNNEEEGANANVRDKNL